MVNTTTYFVEAVNVGGAAIFILTDPLVFAESDDSNNFGTMLTPL